MIQLNYNVTKVTQVLDKVIHDSKFWYVKNTYLVSFDHLAKSVTLPHFAATKEMYPTNIFELKQSISKLLVQLE
jgi:hypothetical protein